MKKNCHNCKYLEYVIAEISDPEGWACNKRDYGTDEEEAKHLVQLEKSLYRHKGKRCFDANVLIRHNDKSGTNEKN